MVDGVVLPQANEALKPYNVFRNQNIGLQWFLKALSGFNVLLAEGRIILSFLVIGNLFISNLLNPRNACNTREM